MEKANLDQVEVAHRYGRLQRVAVGVAVTLTAMISSSLTSESNGVPIACLETETPELHPNAQMSLDELQEDSPFATLPKTDQERLEQFGNKPDIQDYESNPANWLRSLGEAIDLDQATEGRGARTGLRIISHFSSDSNYVYANSDIENSVMAAIDTSDYAPNPETRRMGSCYQDALETKVAGRVLNVYFTENAESVYWLGEPMPIGDVPELDDDDPRPARGLTLPRHFSGQYHIFIAPGVKRKTDETDEVYQTRVNHKIDNILGHEGVHLGQYAVGESIFDFDSLEDTPYELSEIRKKAEGIDTDL